MNIQFQRLRFEKNFPEISLQYDKVTNKYMKVTTQLLFEGWCKCAETLKEDNVSIYFSGTYGWCLERIDGTGLEHPEFDEEEEAIKWATENGLIVEYADE